MVTWSHELNKANVWLNFVTDRLELVTFKIVAECWATWATTIASSRPDFFPFLESEAWSDLGPRERVREKEWVRERDWDGASKVSLKKKFSYEHQQTEITYVATSVRAIPRNSKGGGGGRGLSRLVRALQSLAVLVGWLDFNLKIFG